MADRRQGGPVTVVRTYERAAPAIVEPERGRHCLDPVAEAPGHRLEIVRTDDHVGVDIEARELGRRGVAGVECLDLAAGLQLDHRDTCGAGHRRRVIGAAVGHDDDREEVRLDSPAKGVEQAGQDCGLVVGRDDDRDHRRFIPPTIRRFTPRSDAFTSASVVGIRSPGRGRKSVVWPLLTSSAGRPLV